MSNYLLMCVSVKKGAEFFLVENEESANNISNNFTSLLASQEEGHCCKMEICGTKEALREIRKVFAMSAGEALANLLRGVMLISLENSRTIAKILREHVIANAAREENIDP